MRKLMAAAAAVGVAAVTTRSAGSGGTYSVTITPDASKPPQADPSDGGDPDAATQISKEQADCQQNGGEWVNGHCGYMVVDPMPPPSRGCGCSKTPGSEG